MADLLIYALMFVLVSAVFGGLMLMMETFICTLVDPRWIDRIDENRRGIKPRISI